MHHRPLRWNAALAGLAGGALLLSLIAPRPVLAQEDTGGGMRSPGIFATGLLFSGIGIAGLSAGGYFFSQGEGACDNISTTQIPTMAQIETCKTGFIQQVGGGAAMVSGAVFLIAGIPMIIVGATPEDRPEPAPPPRFSVQAGPTGGAMHMSF
jgi:hypothetical protein